MANDDKIQLIEDEFGFELSYKWFHPSAFIMLLFAIVWNGFLLFWYGALFTSSGSPLIAYLVPLVHLGAGISMAYYTACLFLNRTLIEITDGHFTLKHRPLPWLKGNQKIDVKKLEQFYVKEVAKRNSEGRTTYSYQLRAKIQGGRDIAILDLNEVDSYTLKEIEHKIENYLGITDYLVEGEFEAKGKKTIENVQRKTPKQLNAADLKINGLSVNDILDYEQNTYEVRYITQYDWDNGYTDKQLQLVDHTNKEMLLYIEQNKAIYTPYIEIELNLGEVQRINFLPQTPPTELNYKDLEFQLHHYTKGKIFLNKSTPIATNQWIYKNDDKFHLRIVEFNDLIHVYFGKKELDISFTNLYTA